MTKNIFVLYLIVLSVYLTAAYNKQCAVGPQYWCQSFQNAEDCGAIRHCTDTVWRYDEQRTKVDASTSCEWCQKILEGTHKGLQTLANDEDAVKSHLIDGCKLLPLTDISSKCLTVMKTYGTTVLSLMKHQRYDTICRLMNICSNEESSSEKTVKTNLVDEESKMLCHVIVRATHDLHEDHQKTRSEIQTFLRKDCQQLSSQNLVKKCEHVVDRYGTEIHAHVASGVEPSKVCDYLDDFANHNDDANLPSVHCELCTFVMSAAKYMLNANQAEEKVLSYIDEQVCSRMSGLAKKNCKDMVLNKGKEVLDNIRSETKPMLLCTRFHVCLDQAMEETSPIQKNEMRTLLKTNICDKLGSLEDACHTLIDKDGTRLLQILANNVESNELCHMFGLCPKTSPLLNNLNIGDDPSKCKRCVQDFTRRKHIAKKLVTHAQEFIHHLCGQLPNSDECVKAVDDSFTDLLKFIDSLDPRAICIQLKMCEQNSTETVSTSVSENLLGEEVLQYMKNDICSKLGSLSSWCTKLVESEGKGLISETNKQIDPHRICEILDVCPSNMIISECQDKCQCCTNKVDIYQRKLEKFLRTIVSSTRTMCQYMPAHDVCNRLADVFDSNVDKVVARFDSKAVCQTLGFCSKSMTESPVDQCQTCKNELKIRQDRFRTAVNDITTALMMTCTDNRCRSQVQSAQQETLNQIEKLNTPSICQQLGYCSSDASFQPSPIQLRLRNLVRHQTQSLEQRLEAHDLCSPFGDMKSVCEHLFISSEGQRYAALYQSMLFQNPTILEDYLRDQVPSRTNIDLCSTCKNIVQSTKDFWINAAGTIRDVLLKTCDRCPTKQDCRDYYNRRYNDAKKYIDSIDTTQACARFGLCVGSSLCAKMGLFRERCEEVLAKFSHSIHHDSSLIEQHLPHTSVVVLPSKQQQQQQQQQLDDHSNSTCILCEYFMKILSNYIHQRSSQQEIEQSLEKICQQMPGPLRTQCDEFVDNFGASIIATLINNFDLSTLCRKLNLCTKQMVVDVSHLTKADVASCGICDYVSTYVHFAMKRDPSDRSVSEALNSVCDHLNNEQESQCKMIVELFRPQIRTLKLNLGGNFCQQLTICQTPMSDLKPAVPLSDLTTKDEISLVSEKDKIINNLDEAPQCVLCQYVVSYLSAVMKTNKTEEAIEAALSRVCFVFPRKERLQCTEFVKTYGPVLAQLITDLAEPKLVCRYLGMCQYVEGQEVTTKESKLITYSNHKYARIPV